MSEKWNKEYVDNLSMLPMQQLEGLYSLSEYTDWPNALGLNHIAQNRKIKDVPEFVCQSLLIENNLYYEQIIAQQNKVPTRPNSWHDLFNGLIWLQFPKTKKRLNQQHVADIQRVGLSPRTLRRNNLTHFDECGVVVTYEKCHTESEDMIEQLKAHNWQSVFVKNRALWGSELNTFMFGHANLEMLLKPFIGLTGKWLPIAVERGFKHLTLVEQLQEVDTQLDHSIVKTDFFSQKKPLYPLPLLGIPSVWDANKDPIFYDNTDYFRPKIT